MSRLSSQTISGLFVFLAGLAVVYVVAVGPGSIEAPSEATSTSIADTRVLEVLPPSLEGVDLAIQRVLYASGKAEALRVDQISELPAEVARVLASFGVTLAVPESQAGGGQ